jgi:formylglycine-generating enzyme required for sulfatase activity
MFFAHLWAAFSIAPLAIAATGAAAAPSAAQPIQAGQTFRDCSDCPEMVVIPAGRFTMGASQADIKRAVDAAELWMRRRSMSLDTPVGLPKVSYRHIL